MEIHHTLLIAKEKKIEVVQNILYMFWIFNYLMVTLHYISL